MKPCVFFVKAWLLVACVQFKGKILLVLKSLYDVSYAYKFNLNKKAIGYTTRGKANIFSIYFPGISCKPNRSREILSLFCFFFLLSLSTHLFLLQKIIKLRSVLPCTWAPSPSWFYLSFFLLPAHSSKCNAAQPAPFIPTLATRLSCFQN